MNDQGDAGSDESGRVHQGGREPRTVVVTGGSRGLGAAIVGSFLAGGDRVATCSRKPTAEIEAWMEDPSTADRFHYQAVDMVDGADRAEFVDGIIRRWDSIDVLVNNAGVAPAGVLGIFPDEDVDTVVDLNVKGTIGITKLVVRRMLARGGGRIVNISSVVGLSGYRGLSVYGATKASLDGFTRALARELGGRRITVNSVAPGYLRTEMSHGLSDDQLHQIARRTPMCRLGEPEDVVGAIHFLTGPSASFITGHVLVVDGGLTS